ncbi:geranylgeranyl pyrophosphate synthase [Xylaria bambusicola]|uniref:geranylgeranyl pyrophosphate synthase n=1 Tax=Xylaria bambusicola TaxID=326684 RepID=UPI0020075829|nr:geranylgeranyl pyrophosphate synthase [Xylaria bambusicola]KAI0526192.1 geranylgeranyl pyrophosphate synthase [Xylaria bambusicola]
MPYSYSTVVDPSTYETEGLCDGIDLRKHIAADLEEIGTLRAQEDWRRLVGPVAKPYKGGLNPAYSFMTVSVPECIPERLEIISYANEFAFLHDDVIEVASKDVRDASNDEMLQAFEEGAQTGKIEENGASGKRKIAAQILKEMMEIDPDRAMVAIKSWATFVEYASGRQHHVHFNTLEEYIPYRCLDVGYMFWHGLVTFGCSLTIPDEEAAETRELLTSALIAASLGNDLYSYEKEYEDTMKAGLPDVVNAVWVIMGEHGCSEAEAKEICKERIRIENAKYVKVVEETAKRTDLCDDVKRYIDVMQYSLSGNLVWSIQCPRYNKGSTFSELQLLRAKHGVAKYPALWPPKDGVQGVNATPSSDSAVDLTTNGEVEDKEEDENMYWGINGVGIRVGNGVDAHGVGTYETAATNGAATNGEKKSAHNPQPSADSLVLDNVVALALDKNLPELGEGVVLQPWKYLMSLPSKGFRDQAIDSLNTWLKVPAKTATKIKEVVKMLHNASLMLDDLEDSSPLRRGRPSTHDIYGSAQTVNSATFLYIQATQLASELENQECFKVFTEEMRRLYVGQSYDLYWTHNALCPSIAEYLRMVDDKTGGLFRMLTRMMVAESPVSKNLAGVDLDLLSCLIGRFFQIRDDYQNLASADYAKKKGFAEDLDEGKYSFALIHCIQVLESNPKFAGDAMQLRALLVKRRFEGKLGPEAKREILTIMKKTKSLEYTLGVIRKLHSELDKEVVNLEKAFGGENFQLRLLMEMLKL